MPEPFVTRASGKTKVLHLATRRSQVIVLQPPSWIDVCCFVCFYCAVSADMLDAPRLPCSPFTRSSPMQKDGFQIITLWMQSHGMCLRRSQLSSASISCLKGWLGKQTFLPTRHTTLSNICSLWRIDWYRFQVREVKSSLSLLLLPIFIDIDILAEFSSLKWLNVVKLANQQLLVTCADLSSLRMIRKLLIILSFRRGKHRATSTEKTPSI